MEESLISEEIPINKVNNAFSWKKALKNIWKWDKNDLYYVLLSIIIIMGVFLYYSDRHECAIANQQLTKCCRGELTKSMNTAQWNVNFSSLKIGDENVSSSNITKT